MVFVAMVTISCRLLGKHLKNFTWGVFRNTSRLTSARMRRTLVCQTTLTYANTSSPQNTPPTSSNPSLIACLENPTTFPLSWRQRGVAHLEWHGRQGPVASPPASAVKTCVSTTPVGSMLSPSGDRGGFRQASCVKSSLCPAHHR